MVAIFPPYESLTLKASMPAGVRLLPMDITKPRNMYLQPRVAVTAMHIVMILILIII